MQKPEQEVTKGQSNAPDGASGIKAPRTGADGDSQPAPDGRTSQSFRKAGTAFQNPEADFSGSEDCRISDGVSQPRWIARRLSHFSEEELEGRGAHTRTVVVVLETGTRCAQRVIRGTSRFSTGAVFSALALCSRTPRAGASFCPLRLFEN